YMNQPVVVKTLLDDQLDRRIDQLFTEAQVLRSLDHPAIVRLQDCGYTDPATKSRPYLVMDYFDGVTLEDYVKGHGPLPPERLLPAARQIGEGLLAAPRKNILHPGGKPAHGPRPEEPRRPGAAAPGLKVQLIDFGLALPQSALRETQKRSNTLIGASIAGTLEYAAPEQMGRLPGTEPGPYSDIYGFGKTCSYALFQTSQPVLKHWQSVPEPLADLLSRCMGERPDERPIDFDTVLRCLNRLEKPAAVTAGPRRGPARGGRGRRRGGGGEDPGGRPGG